MVHDNKHKILTMAPATEDTFQVCPDRGILKLRDLFQNSYARKLLSVVLSYLCRQTPTIGHHINSELTNCPKLTTLEGGLCDPDKGGRRSKNWGTWSIPFPSQFTLRTDGPVKVACQTSYRTVNSHLHKTVCNEIVFLKCA